jgi:hypothetical protein
VKFYKYWARAEAPVHKGRRPWSVCAYGGSDESPDQAQRAAQDRADRTAAAIESGRTPDMYAYADRPLREEIVQEIRDANSVSAVITRNSYGSLVLNTNRVMFVDVDFHPGWGQGRSIGESLRRIWLKLQGKSSSERRNREDELLSRFDSVCDNHGLGFRIYRTFAGYRLLLTSGTFDPLAAETRTLMEAFGSDPLYIRLCKSQECFRARLSAKFWRCGVRRPPSRFPWADAAREQEYRVWEDDYHRVANKFAVCALVGSRGVSAVDPSVQTILDTHDQLTIQDGAMLA